MDIKITILATELDASELSGSVAERGANAGAETWANSMEAAEDYAPILANDEERENARKFFKGFGAWSRQEIAGWSDQELDALVLQYAAGDWRELESLCPGNGAFGIDWNEAEALADAGTISGSIFASGEDLYIYIGN